MKDALRKRRRRAALVSAALVSWLALSACAPGNIREARSALRTNDLGTARRLLEQDRDDFPRSFDVRVALGEVYYRIARDALDWEGDEGRYLAFLEKSVDEFMVAMELDPKDHQPHFYLAMMDAYRGDLQGALRGLQNSRRLQPGPIADTNIAELYVYLGNLEAASRWNQSGYLAGAGLGPVTFNRMLMHWRQGDLESARHEFRVLHDRYPDTIRTINVAPLPVMPGRFEEFARYCCESPACGPYLEDACRDLSLPVKRREVSEETLLQELRLEMEKKRRLHEIYRQRKELEIEVDQP